MRILLISYYFPPFNAVGAVRPGKLAAYLNSRGHEVDVLTCANPAAPLDAKAFAIAESCVTRVPEISINRPVDWLMGGRTKTAQRGYQGAGVFQPIVQKLGKLFKTLFHWPDGQMRWVGVAVNAGRKLMRTRRYDLIYVSGPPFSSFRVAATLARQFVVPWVAELRDLWTGNHAYSYPFWRRWLEKTWENRLLRQAKALVTVSAPLARSISGFGIPVWEIRNGYDPEESAETGGWEPGPLGEIGLAYTGSVYPGPYDLNTFCAGLRLFYDEGGRVKVTAAGRNLGGLERAFVRHGLQNQLKIFPTLARAKALGLQRNSDSNVLFLWKGAAGVYPTKFFEYVQAGRPILAIGDKNDELARWIRQECMGIAASTPSQISDALKKWAREKKLAGRLGKIRPRSDYTRNSQFQKLEAQLIAMAVPAKHGGHPENRTPHLPKASHP